MTSLAELLCCLGFCVVGVGCVRLHCSVHPSESVSSVVVDDRPRKLTATELAHYQVYKVCP